VGWRRNPTFWVSLYVKLFATSQSFVEQVEQVILELLVTGWKTLAVSGVTTTVDATLLVLVSACWIFPMLFSIVGLAPVVAGLLLLFVGFMIGEQALSRLPRLCKRVRVYACCLVVHGLLVLVYPACNANRFSLHGSCAAAVRGRATRAARVHGRPLQRHLRRGVHADYRLESTYSVCDLQSSGPRSSQ
jgi:hypothetical protein